MSYELRIVDVCRVSLDAVREERKKLPEEKRNYFKLSVAEALGLPVSTFRRSEYEIHHIVPLSLGGKSTYENLCLIRIVAHEKVSNKIFRQVEFMEFGEKKTIDIPFPKRPFVWNMEDFVSEEDVDTVLVWENGRCVLQRDWMAPLREELSIYSTANRGIGAGAALTFKL